MESPAKKPAGQLYLRHPFLLSIDQIVEQLGTNVETGLSRLKAQQSQHDYGPNKLKGEGNIHWHTILAKQISNAMILVCFQTIFEDPRPVCDDGLCSYSNTG